MTFKDQLIESINIVALFTLKVVSTSPKKIYEANPWPNSKLDSITRFLLTALNFEEPLCEDNHKVYVLLYKNGGPYDVREAELSWDNMYNKTTITNDFQDLATLIVHSAGRCYDLIGLSENSSNMLPSS